MKYWIILNNTQFGPMEARELLSYRPTLDTPVWHEGLENWVALREVPALRTLIERSINPTDAQTQQWVEVEETEKSDNSVTIDITEGETKVEERQEPYQGSDDPKQPQQPEQPKRQYTNYPNYGNPNPQQGPYGQPNGQQYGASYGQQNGYGQQHYGYPYGNGGMGQPRDPNYYPPCPPTYLVWSILSIFLCCFPLGIVAVIYSSKVRPAYDRGDFAEAERASNTAMWWLIAAIVVGLVTAPFFAVCSMMGA